MFDLKSSANPSGSAKENAPGVDPTEGAAYKQKTYQIDSTLTAQPAQGTIAAGGFDEAQARDAALAQAAHLQLAWGCGNRATEVAPALKDIRPLFNQPIAPKDLPKNQADTWFQGHVPLGTALPFKRAGWRPEQMSIMLVDIDGGNVPVERVIELTTAFFGTETIAAAYSSSSARPDDQRWRVAVPLARPTETALWRQAMKAFGAFLGANGVPFDRSLLTVNQPVYAPNVPHQLLNKDGSFKAHGRWPAGTIGFAGDDSGKPIFFVHRFWGHRLVDLAAISAPIGREALRQQAQRDEAEAQAAQQRKADAEKRYAEREARRAELLAQGVDGRTPIEIFRELHDTRDLLVKYGFQEDPSKTNHWCHPELQTTGSYATEVLPDGKWRTLSSSLRDAGLGRPSGSDAVNHGDQFDLLVFFQYGGDRNAALKAVAQAAGLPARVKHTPADLIPFNQGLQPMPEALRPFSGAGEGVATLTPDKALQLDLKPMNWLDLSQTTPEPPRWRYEGWLPEGYVTLLSANGGVGKSNVSLQLGVALATGVDLFGVPAAKSKVLVMSGEDNARTVHFRVSNICADMGIQMRSLHGLLDVYDLTQQDCVLWRDGQPTARMAWLEKMVHESGAQVVVIDNTSDVFADNENDRTAVRAFMRALNLIASKTGAAVLLLAHVDKASARGGAGLDSDTTYSGSTAWNNSARSRWAMVRDGQSVILRHEKCNHGPKQDDIRIEFDTQRDVFKLYASSPELVAAHHAREHALSMVVLGLIDKAVSAGKVLSDKPTARNNAFKELRDDPSYPKKLPSKDFFNLLSSLQKGGHVVTEDFDRGNRTIGQRLCLTDTGKALIAGPFDAIPAESSECVI